MYQSLQRWYNLAMTKEFISFADTDRTWTYNTLYDMADRAKILQNEGIDSERFQHLENYIDYINNHMPSDYRVSAEVTDPRAFNPYPSKVSYGSTSVQLYQIDKSGAFVPYRCTTGMEHFVGDKIILEDEEPFIYNSKYKLAARPMVNKSVEMINIIQGSGDGKGYSDYLLFECRAKEVMRFQAFARRIIPHPQNYSI